MDLKLACGDNNIVEGDNDEISVQMNEKPLVAEDNKSKEEESDSGICSETKLPIEKVNEKEMHLKERIANCRKIIESLKLELTEEKAKLQEEAKSSEILLTESATFGNTKPYTTNSISSSYKTVNDITPLDINYLYSSSVDNKLRCNDDSLMEYEKQLQRYQDTLTMAQTEKKNAIRKQMLAKVYKLKLLEVENHCNIELLRVKQSLQCLEPLQMIVNKWKSRENETTCNLNNYELIPRYPELNPISNNDVNIFTDDEKCEFFAPDKDA